MFGTYGDDQGQFYEPVDVDVDNEGFVYVTDSGNNRVQKFTPDGQFVCSFGEEQSEPRSPAMSCWYLLLMKT